MAAMQRQLVVSLGDLRYVSVECAHCGSSVTLDMKQQTEHQTRFGFAPAVCPVCQKPHDTSMQNLEGFSIAYRALLGVADRITLRGAVETTEP